MSLQYIVASPGRAGSVFTTLVISNSLKLTPLFDVGLVSNETQSVLHTHDPCFQADKNIPVICTQRKNLFDQIISSYMANQYQEWYQYTDNGDSFVADINIFEKKYTWYKFWNRAFDTHTTYLNKTYITFEDFIGNSRKLCNILNIPEIDFQSQQSMRNPQEYILNYSQLKEKFDLIENDLHIQTTNNEIYNWADQDYETQRRDKQKK